MGRNKRFRVVLYVSLVVIAIALLLAIACKQTNNEGTNPVPTQDNSCQICGHYLSSITPDLSIVFNKNGTYRTTYQQPGQPAQSSDGYWTYDGNYHYTIKGLLGTFAARMQGNNVIYGYPDYQGNIQTVIDTWIKQ
jgi:hypothetical protein